MIIDVVFWLIMAIVSVTLIELRGNYRINHLVDLRIKELGLQPYHRSQKQVFGKREVLAKD